MTPFWNRSRGVLLELYKGVLTPSRNVLTIDSFCDRYSSGAIQASLQNPQGMEHAAQEALVPPVVVPLSAVVIVYKQRLGV